MKSRPTQSQLRGLLALIGEGNTLSSAAEFQDFIVGRLPLLVPCDSISYNEVDPTRGHVISLLSPDHDRFPGDVQTLGALLHEHPLVVREQQTGDGRAFKISDFLSQEEFHSLALYQQVYSRLRTEYQIAFTLPVAPPLILAIALNRQARDFTEAERELLNLARPHLALIHRRIESQGAITRDLQALQRAVDGLGYGVIVLDEEARVHRINGEAQRMLRHFAGEQARPGDPLPWQLGAWVAGQLREFRGDFETPPPAEAMVSDQSSARLVARFLPPLLPEDRAVVLLEHEGRLDPEVAAGFGLTARETDVLARVAAGATNAEIAAATGVSIRTVSKHLEHIYSKLAVSTRTAAVAKVSAHARPVPGAALDAPSD